MEKEDCKYWDKCYQKNEYHLKKYNHPNGKDDTAACATKEELCNATTGASKDVEAGNSDDDSNAERTKKDRKKFDTTELYNEAMANIAGKNYAQVMEKRIRLSYQLEYEKLLESKEFIRHKFLVEMPEEFYKFWEFLVELYPNDDASQVIECVEKRFNLQLVGPFEYLGGIFHDKPILEPGDYLRHWRFYYDPPEFQTVFVKKGSGIHYGYWRDVPQDKEKLLLARNDCNKNCEFEFIASNAFNAFLYYLTNDLVVTPFGATAVANAKKAVQAFISKNDLKLDAFETIRKSRNAKVVTRTFHRAGIVVAFDNKTATGYRPLIVSDAELKKIIKLFEAAGGKGDEEVEEDVDDNKDADKKDDSIKRAVTEKLQPIATAAMIATDECDFGTALEFGIDLFSSGRRELHMLAQTMLVPAYTLLNRPQYVAISKAHMEKRRKKLNLNMFDNN